MWFSLNYRNKSFRKYQIQILEPQGVAHEWQVFVTIRSVNKPDESFDLEIHFDRMYLLDNFENFRELLGRYGSEPYSGFMVDFLADLFQTKKLSKLHGLRISFHPENEYSSRVILDENSSFLQYRRDPILRAKENRFARILLLRTLHSLGWNPARKSLIEECHYLSRPLDNALQFLEDKRYIKIDKDVRLTDLGVEFVEKMLLTPFNDKIFLIAACMPDIEKLIESVYRPAVEEVGHTLVFQEHTEPENSIHEDIWAYLADCKLIICDLTHQRPNCFIEYGFAIGKEKQVILCVEKTEGLENNRLTMPFDTLTQKYSFRERPWVDGNDQAKLTQFKEEIKERISMKLGIIEMASTI